MPEDVRRIYESVMSAIDKDHDGIPDAIQTGRSISKSNLSVTPPPSQRVIEPENSNKSLLIVVIAVGVLFVLALAVLMLVMAMR
jgi:hypothetical protein